jgi:hypothetical protein
MSATSAKPRSAVMRIRSRRTPVRTVPIRWVRSRIIKLAPQSLTTATAPQSKRRPSSYIEQYGCRERVENQIIASVALGGRHRWSSGWALDGRITYAYAEEENPLNRITAFVQEDVLFAPNVAPDSIDPDNIQANPLNETLSEFFLDGVEDSRQLTTDRDLVVAGNVASPLLTHDVWGTRVKFGFKYRAKRKFRNNDAIAYSPEDDVPLAGFLDAGFDPGNLLGGRYAIGPFSLPGASGSLIGGGGFEAEFDNEEDAGDFLADEDLAAGYVMAQIYRGERLLLVPGLRYERTKVDYSGFRVLFDGDGDYVSTLPVSGENSFDAVLPSITARVRLDESTNLRFAVSSSSSRTTSASFRRPSTASASFSTTPTRPRRRASSRPTTRPGSGGRFRGRTSTLGTRPSPTRSTASRASSRGITTARTSRRSARTRSATSTSTSTSSSTSRSASG